MREPVLSPIHTADADATKLFCRVASTSAVCTCVRRLPTDSAMRTHNAAVGRYPVHDCRRVCRPTHRRHDETVANSTVSSRRRGRCVLGFIYVVYIGLRHNYVSLPFNLVDRVDYSYQKRTQQHTVFDLEFYKISQ